MENVKNTKKWLMLFITTASIASASLSFGMNIWDAIRNNNIDRVKELIGQEGFDFNQTDNYGDTPLNLACLKNNIEILKLLLEYGAKESVNKVNNMGETTLYIGCMKNNIEIIKLLLPHCLKETINKANYYGNTPLYWACYNNLEIVRFLFEWGANIDQKSLKQAQNILKDPDRQAVEQQILATFNLTQRFDECVVKNDIKSFNLTVQERQDQDLCKFIDRLLNNRRIRIISTLKYLDKALTQKFEPLDDCAVKCEFENLKEVYN